MRRLHLILVHAATALILFLLPGLAWAGPNRQDATPSPEVSRILENLSPEERVGQLFIVTFQGTSVAEGTPVHTLITRYHVGGVILSAANDNFDDAESLPISAAALTETLQRAVFLAANPVPDEEGAAPTPQASTFIPLLVGVAHEGNGAPFTEMRSGMTPLPSAMSLGATWSPENARLVGDVTGSELSKLGINLLLGPTLDVLTTPQPTSPGDLGVRAFGGDPYWVGVMGRAYVEGVKVGSGGRVAVMAQHFPGLGVSDRDVSSEIPAVNKSLDELMAIDLAPFAVVTSPTGESQIVVDGLLTAHARYTALQGAASGTTRPFNLDAQALSQMLRQPELAGWRAAGGVTMSDRLGARGVRLFYDPTGATFPAFNIARDALLAGNDLLFLDEFGLNPPEDQAETIANTIELFVQKYQEDPAFAELVDEAAARVIALKLRLYGQLSLSRALPAANLEAIGLRTPDVFAVARESATLLSPSPAEIANRLPRPPLLSEQVVFVTDALLTRQCSTCLLQNELAVDDLQQAVLRLYGISGAAQVRSTDLSSFSFGELNDFLSGIAPVPTEEAPESAEGEAAEGEAPEEQPTAEGTPVATEEPELSVGDALAEAEWVVFSLRDMPPEKLETNALRRFLAERPDLVANRNIVVFAFGAPYLLDATEVAQLSAYYGLFSHTAPFVEVAARILFQEITPEGAAPVSVAAASYNLAQQLSPAAEQVFQLFAEMPETEEETDITPSPEVSPTASITPTLEEGTPIAPAVDEGSIINLITSTLLDNNGHVVPDGTLVEFSITYQTEGDLTDVFARVGTVDGVARATLVPERTGLLEVHAQSGEAHSNVIPINVLSLGPEGQVTLLPTATPEATETVTPTATSIPSTATPTLTPTPIDSPPPSPPPVEVRDLFSAFLALAVIGGLGWRFSNSRGRAISSGVKVVLAVAIGVGLGYNYYALLGPHQSGLESLGSLGPTFAAWVGGLAGLLLGLLWLGRKRTE